MPKDRPKTIADHVIAKCGGVQTVADWLGISLPQVYKFTYDKERGGTGGIIPARHQPTLLQKSREVGGDLQPADFFDVGGVHGDDASRVESAA